MPLLSALSLGRHVAGFAALCAVSAFAQPANPMVREGVTEKISAHVYVIPDGSVSLVPNVGIIVGTRATLVIDTGLGARNGQAVLREVAKVSRHQELYLATTHVHPEHDLGAGAFPPGTKMLRSADQQKDIAEFGLQLAKTFSTRSPFVAELLKGAEFRPADIVFEREHMLDLGGVRVRLLAMGANHTRGDTALFVETDGVLFSGDVVMRPLPSFASPYSTIRHWLESLDTLEQLQPKQIVPSHGLKGDATLIGRYRTFLTEVQTRTAEQKKVGLTLEETLPLVTAALQDKYPDRARLNGAVRAAYAEAR
ncbi:MAG: MBL fold metallo-hydrolase [Verrucomicrobia bacterium]|nr:MBL fold metallo-hydrolase [Verrucomicrobiota bacterium]